jgi:ribA/ribD-fused uncharacterized protein
MLSRFTAESVTLLRMKNLPAEVFERYFCAYSAHAIEYKGTLYPTVEHAYHCQRYTDPSVIEEVRNAQSPFKAWQVSQKYKTDQLPHFNEIKVAVMKDLCRAKLLQHEDVRLVLTESGDSKIIKHVTTGPKADGFWCDGEDGTGRNEAGNIWMELRDEL